ncbi:MAG: 16S rRNA processing protein RimM, partial [Anaerolineae bacterium]|nr:16S rRNA processing protein RimM [Anaerolineae bacterium]
MSLIVSPKYLLVGEILRPHGVRGELRMRILTDYPERLARLKHVYFDKDPDSTDPTPHKITHVRFHQNYALLTLVDVPSRNEADLFRELFVLVDIDEAVPLEDDEIYLFQLIGMTVETETGEQLGTISDVLETGANDVYVVDSPQYGEVLLPVTDETLISTDTDANRVIMKL